jgi:serine/threonine-protein kinase
MIMKCPKKHHSTLVRHQLLFIKEALITGQLDHPNIPPIYDLWVNTDNEVCFTMKLVRGQTLSKKIKETLFEEGRTRESLEPLLDMLMKVCDAVDFAYENGVYHRDIKPDNIMVGSHGEVMLMDWGCALVHPTQDTLYPLQFPLGLLDATREKPKTTLGTLSYMSPEQARGKQHLHSIQSEIYLLGGILYSILTGHSPRPRLRSQEENLHLAQSGYVMPPHLRVVHEHLPPKLCAIAKKALHPNPQKRYQSIPEFKDALKNAIKEGWWFRTIRLPKGHVLFKEGEEGKLAYIILKGECEAYRVREGVFQSLSRMGVGEVFGETAIFSQAPRSASIRVTHALTALEVSEEAFEKELSEGSWLQVFVKALARRFKDLDRYPDLPKESDQESDQS